MQYMILADCYNTNSKDKVLMQYWNRPLTLPELKIGEEILVKFKDRGWFRHEKVINIDETDYGVWIETTKKTWRFDNCDDNGKSWCEK